MISILEKFLQDNYRQLPGETSKQLMLYIAFVQCFCRKYDYPIDFTRDIEGLLPELFQTISGYDIKEAAVTFDAAMPWSILKSSPSLLEDIQKLNLRIYSSKCATAEWLGKQIEVICNLDNTVSEVTSRPVREFVAKLALDKHYESIVDVCSGTYSLGLQLWSEMGCPANVRCIGEEIDGYLCALSRLFLFLNNISLCEIREVNVMASRRAESEDSKNPVIYLSDLPLTGNKTVPIHGDNAIVPIDISTVYADWYVMQEVLGRMKAGDKAIFLVTKGALVRKNEYLLRKLLVENDWLDAVIHMPRDLSKNRNTSVEILVFEKERATERKGRILFADMGSAFNSHKKEMASSVMRTMTDIVDDFSNFTAQSQFTKIVTRGEIEDKDYSLFPSLYLSSQEVLKGDLKLGDVAVVTRGLQHITAFAEAGSRYLLNVRDIHNNKICYDNADKVESEKADWDHKYRIQEDDIVITCKGAALKLAIVPPDPQPAYISGNLTIIRVDPTRYSPYVLYEYLISERGQLALSLIQTGTTIRVLGSKNLEQLAIPNYDKKVVDSIGDALKKAAVKYEETLRTINRTYQNERDDLLTKLKKGMQK